MEILELVKWDTLRNIGESSLVKKSFFYFIVIPIIARILYSFEQLLNIVYDSADFDFSMPTVFFLMFLGVLLFFVCRLLYLYFCPKIIINYSDFQQFSEKSNSITCLLDDFFADYDRAFPDSKRTDILLAICNALMNTTLEEQNEKQLKDRLKSLTASMEISNSEIFEILSRNLLFSFPLVRASMGILYLLGILLIFSGTIFNIGIMISYMLF
jgi:hypothetical protein